jgi:hypothetical protein
MDKTRRLAGRTGFGYIRSLIVPNISTKVIFVSGRRHFIGYIYYMAADVRISLLFNRLYIRIVPFYGLGMVNKS